MSVLDKKIARPHTRRLVQLYAALLYNANLKGFIDGHIYSGNLKAACVPGFNCYSCPGAIASCPLGSLQNALNAAGHTAPWYVMGILALFGVILGRTICGWICPLGLIQELLHRIPTRKIRKSRITRMLSWLKYVFLAVFVVAIPLIWGVGKGVILPGFCKYICPAGTFEGAVGLLQNPANATSFYQLGALFTNKWVIMIVIGLACIFCYRSFCRFICPLGAIYGFFNRFALTGVKVNPDRCNGCGLCVMKCEMDVKHVGDHECISCGRCVSACAQGAISLKCGKITLLGPETGKNADPEPEIRKRKKAGRVAWGIAIAVLVFAVAWFNFIEPATDRSNAPAAAVTEQAGDRPVKRSRRGRDGTAGAGRNPCRNGNGNRGAGNRSRHAGRGIRIRGKKRTRGSLRESHRRNGDRESPAGLHHRPAERRNLPPVGLPRPGGHHQLLGNDLRAVRCRASLLRTA